MTAREGLVETIPGRTATLFLVAGLLFIVFAAFHGVEAFLHRAAPKDIVGPAGFAFAFVGMLGLYPDLAGRSPWLSRIGAIFALLGAAAAAVTSVWHVGLWVLPASMPPFVAAVSIGMVLGQFPGYVSFGLASLRTDIHPRTVGLLLVAVPTVLAVMIVTVATGYATSGSAVVLGSVQALIHLAIGFSIRTAGASSDRAVSPVETTPK